MIASSLITDPVSRYAENTILTACIRATPPRGNTTIRPRVHEPLCTASPHSTPTRPDEESPVEGNESIFFTASLPFGPSDPQGPRERPYEDAQGVRSRKSTPSCPDSAERVVGRTSASTPDTETWVERL